MKEPPESEEPRIDYADVAPEGVEALRKLEEYVAGAGFAPSLLELVRTRASQINGCAYCVDMHTRDARADGESEQRLYALSVWRETPFYTPRERAALEWTEAVTRVGREGGRGGPADRGGAGHGRAGGGSVVIRLKRAYDPPAAEDGYRVLVDRLWPRGVAREDAEIDLWMQEVAPGQELREWFGHDPERWEAFNERYGEELRAKEDAVELLREKDREGTLTLVYAARDTEHNNAVALREYLEEPVEAGVDE